MGVDFDRCLHRRLFRRPDGAGCQRRTIRSTSASTARVRAGSVCNRLVVASKSGSARVAREPTIAVIEKTALAPWKQVVSDYLSATKFEGYGDRIQPCHCLFLCKAGPSCGNDRGNSRSKTRRSTTRAIACYLFQSNG